MKAWNRYCAEHQLNFVILDTGQAILVKMDKYGIHFALVMSICWDGEPGIPSRRRGRLPAHPD